MKRLMALMLALVCLMMPVLTLAISVDPWYNGMSSGSWTYEDGVTRDNTYGYPQSAKLLQRLATRSGPSTNYDELGSYHKKGYEVQVYSKAYDERNGIWWLQVEFTYGDTLRRAYTGLKRVDIDIDTVPEEYPIYTAKVSAETVGFYGPGTHYARHKGTVEVTTVGTIYAFEDGWAHFEYYDTDKECYRRVWMDAGCLNWTGKSKY